MSYPFIAFAPRVTELTNLVELPGSFVSYGFTLSNLGGASFILVTIQNSVGTTVLPGMVINANTTLHIECPLMVSNGLVFNITSGTTTDGRFTVFHSNVGA